MRYMPRPPSEEDEIDDHFKQAVEVVAQYDRASASLIQRRLGIGYARSARIIDQLEAAGVVGPAVGSVPREVLNSRP
jgi:DNA segregation ATPase FtsK/SpoIIIE, S-DNA-T family